MSNGYLVAKYVDSEVNKAFEIMDEKEDFERAVEEARHYILMDTDTFAVRVGDIVIRRVK